MMMRSIACGAVMLGFAFCAMAEEPEQEAADDKTEVEEESFVKSGDGQPTTMSGMSILGNEEAPKSLVIVPWKSSELGAELGLTNTLDDRAQPIDRDVFLRELSYYELRSAK